MVCKRRLQRLRSRKWLVILIVIVLFIGMVLTYNTLNGHLDTDSKLQSYFPTRDNNQNIPRESAPMVKTLRNKSPSKAEKVRGGRKADTKLQEVLTLLYPRTWVSAKGADEVAILLKDKMLELNLSSGMSCRDIALHQIQGSLGYSRRKFIDRLDKPRINYNWDPNMMYQGGQFPLPGNQYPPRPFPAFEQSVMVMKSPREDHQSRASCLEEVNDPTFCGPMGNYLLLREVFLLQVLRHPNLIRLLGYCLKGDTVSPELSKKGVVVVMEMGAPFMSSLLSSLAWARRVQLAHGIASLLAYLEQSPVGSVGLPKVKPKDFVLVQETVLKLTDLVDAQLEEKTCSSDDGCFLDSVDIGVKCHSGRCQGLNERTNLRMIGPPLILPLLQNAPAEARPTVERVLNSIRRLDIPSKELLAFMDSLLKNYTVQPETTVNYPHWRHDGRGRDAEQEDKGVRSKMGTATLNSDDPGDASSRFVRVDSSNFPGQYDYICPHTRVQWGCVLVQENVEAAMDWCLRDPQCRSFIVFSSHPEDKRKVAVVFKMDNKGPAKMSSGTTLYLLRDGEDNNKPHPDDRRHPEDRSHPDDRRHPEDRPHPEEKRFPEDGFQPDHRRQEEDRPHPDDRRFPEERPHPDDRRYPEERRHSDDRRFPEDRPHPDDKNEDRPHPDDRRYPEDRLADSRAHPDDRHDPDEREHPNRPYPEERPHDRAQPDDRAGPDNRPYPDDRPPPDNRPYPDHRPHPDDRSNPENRPYPDDRLRLDDKPQPDDRPRPDHRPHPDDRAHPEDRRQGGNRPGWEEVQAPNGGSRRQEAKFAEALEEIGNAADAESSIVGHRDKWGRRKEGGRATTKADPWVKVKEIKTCLERGWESQGEALYSREKRIMTAMGMKGKLERDWRQAVQVESVSSVSGLRGPGGGEKGGAEVGGRMTVHFNTSTAGHTLTQALFMVERGPRYNHVAFAMLHAMDRLLGLYHVPPTVGGFLRGSVVARLASDRIWNTMFGPLTHPDGTLRGLFVMTPPKSIKMASLTLQPLAELTSEVKAFDRTEKMQLEYVLLWWLGHMDTANKQHYGVKGLHLIHLDGDGSFQSKGGVSSFAGYLNHCQFPNVAYRMIQCFRCRPPNSSVCLLGQEVVRKVTESGFKMSDLRIPELTEQEYPDMINTAASQIVDIIDNCIQRFGRESVLY